MVTYHAMSCFVKFMFVNFCVFYKSLANHAFVFQQITLFSSKIFCFSAQQHEHQQVFRYFSTVSLLTCSTDVGRDKFFCRHDPKSVITFAKTIGEVWFPSPVAQIFWPWIYEMSCLLIWNMWCFDQTDAHINAVQKFKFWSRNCVIILTPVF